MRKWRRTVGYAGALLVLASSLRAQTPTLSVKITSPAGGTNFAKCSDLVVTTDPQIQGGEIKSVGLFRNGVGMSAKSKAPFEFKLANFPPGYYVLVAKLTAKTGETAFSDPVIITVGDAEQGNVLMNGGFDCSLFPWTLGLSGGAVATVTIDTAAGLSGGGAAFITIENGGTANWHVQFQQPVAIDSGHTYLLSFTALSSESTRPINIAIQQTGNPYNVYYQVDPTLEGLQDYGPFVYECVTTDHAVSLRINVGNINNTMVWLDGIKWVDQTLTGLNERKSLNAAGTPASGLLSRNYPNPFNPGTTIQYRLPGDGSVTLSLFNLRGQLVRTLVQEKQQTGDHSIRWNGENEAGERVPSGVYVYLLRLRTADGSFTVSRKIMSLE
jgi:hypothetical protein